MSLEHADRQRHCTHCGEPQDDGNACRGQGVVLGAVAGDRGQFGAARQHPAQAFASRSIT